MIRVTLAQGAAEHLAHDVAPRRPDETLYDFMVRATHETGIEIGALRALLDAHARALAEERAAVARRTRLLLVGQSIVAGLVAAVAYRPDTPTQGGLIILLVAAISGCAGRLLQHFARPLDRIHRRLAGWWQ